MGGADLATPPAQNSTYQQHSYLSASAPHYRDTTRGSSTHCPPSAHDAIGMLLQPAMYFSTVVECSSRSRVLAVVASTSRFGAEDIIVNNALHSTSLHSNSVVPDAEVCSLLDLIPLQMTSSTYFTRHVMSRAC